MGFNQNSFSNVSKGCHVKSSSIERPINPEEASKLSGCHSIRPIVKSNTQASITTKDVSQDTKMVSENHALKKQLDEASRQINYLKNQLFEQMKLNASNVCSLCKVKTKKGPMGAMFVTEKAEKECEEDLLFLKLEMQAINSSETPGSNNVSNTTSSYSSNKPS